jgi:hypothetical protein
VGKIDQLRAQTNDLKWDKNKMRRRLSCYSFYRSIIFGQCLAMHEQALEELNYVIENRSSLPEGLTKSNYFTFVLREMKQTQFEAMRRIMDTKP